MSQARNLQHDHCRPSVFMLILKHGEREDGELKGRDSARIATESVDAQLAITFPKLQAKLQVHVGR